jgi:hypothetical protein
VRFSFCVGGGSTDDLQQHQLATRSEGREGDGEATSLITLCLGCDGLAKPLAQSAAACTPDELLRRLKIMARSPLSRKPHASSVGRARRSALTLVSPGSMEAPRRGRPARGKRAQAQLLRRHVTTLVLTSGEAAERGPKKNGRLAGKSRSGRPFGAYPMARRCRLRWELPQWRPRARGGDCAAKPAARPCRPFSPHSRG